MDWKTGKGASCNVYLGKCYLDQNNYAIKIMKLQKRIQDDPRFMTFSTIKFNAAMF